MSEGNSVKEIETRMSKAARALAKLKLVLAIVLSVLVYDAETWTLNIVIGKRIC